MSQPTQTPSSPFFPSKVARRLVWLFIGTQIVLLLAEFGSFPPLAHFWATNLWSYLPPVAPPILAAAVVLLCIPRARNALGELVERSLERMRSPTGRARDALALTLAFLAFYGLRERVVAGDSLILVSMAERGLEFFVPEMGASFMFWLGTRIDWLFDLERAFSIRLLISLSGAFAVLLLIRVSEAMADDRWSRFFIVAYVLSAGLLRILMGHVEVYAFVLVAGLLYVWASLSYLDDRCHWIWPVLAFGTGVWVHFQFVFLLPSLFVVVSGLLREQPLFARAMRLLGLGAIAAAPSLLFLVLVYAFRDSGYTFKVSREAVQTILGLRVTEGVPGRWVGVFDREVLIGTDYALFSRAQWKYLANAAFMLGPWTVPLLLLILLTVRSQLSENKAALFLGVGALPLVVYAFVLRPMWGPYDWDLFALTALFLSLCVVRVVARHMRERQTRALGTWLLATAFLFVGLPLLWIGVSVARPAGPFVPYSFGPKIIEPGTEAHSEFSRWL